MLSVVIAGGGTGGHLFPGLAVARELIRRRQDAVVSFAGTSRGIEARVVPREGFALDCIRSGGLKGKSVLDRLRGAALIPLSLWDAWRVVAARRPHVVIGVGGYSSGPVVLAAAARGIPTVVLEQNAVPGLTNRMLAPIVKAAAVTFEATLVYFGSKAFVSGNPVRTEFFEAEQRGVEAASEVHVLVFGGSQGAHAINMAMIAAAPTLSAAAPRLRLVHQTGARDADAVREAYRHAHLDAVVEPFLYDMGRQVAQADLVVCRAGATTLAEIAAARRPAILVPLPTATDDHQRRNAESVAAAGGAEVLLQADLSGERLAASILRLAGDVEGRARMAAAAGTLARPDAARAIVDRVLELACA